MRLTTLFHAALFALAAGIATPQASAQALDFRPVLYVNDSAITGYELNQRVRFLQILRTQGDLAAIARQQLIDDRLRLQAGRQFGVQVTEQEVRAGMAEFAGRANLSTEEFLAAVGQGGVAPETFRDFVKAGLVWRKLVRGRFEGQVSIPEAEAERALAVEAGRGLPARVLLSELVIPREPGESREDLFARAQALGARLRGEGAFAAAARDMSIAPTAEEGGRLDWQPVTDLPGPARAAISGLAPGQVSPPIPAGDGAAIFLLRGLREAAQTAAQGVHVEFATLALGGAEAGERIAARTDSCTDLFGEVDAEDAERLQFQTLPEAQLPEDLRSTLAALDAGETALISRGGAPVLVMLCARRAGAPEDVPAIDAMRGMLTNEQLAAKAELWLDDLRANAIIREP